MVFSGECVRVDGRIKLDFHRQLCFSLAFQSDCIDEKLEEYEVGGTYSCVGVEAAGRVGVSVLSLKLVVGGISSSIILTCLIRVALGELYPDQRMIHFPWTQNSSKKNWWNSRGMHAYLASPNLVLGLLLLLIPIPPIPGGLKPPGLPGPPALPLDIPNPPPGVLELPPPSSFPAVEVENEGRNLTPSAIRASSGSSSSFGLYLEFGVW